MTDALLILIKNNLKEIIRACPNTYSAYVAQTTLNKIEGKE